jgi:uncharacterized membrane protein YgcG
MLQCYCDITVLLTVQQVLAATQKFVSLHCLLTGGHITLEKASHNYSKVTRALYSCYSYLHCCCSARLQARRAALLHAHQLSRHKKLDSAAASTAPPAPPSTDIETAFGKLRHGDAPSDPKMPPQSDSPAAHRGHNSSVIIRDTFHEQLAPALERAVAATAVLLQSYQTARLHILYGLDQTADGRRSSGSSSSSSSSSSGNKGNSSSGAATRPGNELVLTSKL